MAYSLIVVIVAFAVFVQTSTGFGIALVSMPLLVSLVGLEIAAPLVALVAMTNRLVMLVYYRESFDRGEVQPLMLGAIAGIVIGSLLMLFIPFGKHSESVIETLLGLLVLAYVGYVLFAPHMPAMGTCYWSYGLGFAGGMLARIFNAGGLPAVVYADGRGWAPATFKGNLQAYAVISGCLVIAARAINGEFVDVVMQAFLYSIPGIAFGLAAGFILDRYMDAVRFRKIILILMVMIALQLILT